MRSLDYARDDVKRKILRLRAKRQLKINLRNKLKLYKKRNNSRHRTMQRNAPNTSSRLERSGMERSHTFALAKVNVSQIYPRLMTKYQ